MTSLVFFPKGTDPVNNPDEVLARARLPVVPQPGSRLSLLTKDRAGTYRVTGVWHCLTFGPQDQLHTFRALVEVEEEVARNTTDPQKTLPPLDVDESAPLDVLRDVLKILCEHRSRPCAVDERGEIHAVILRLAHVITARAAHLRVMPDYQDKPGGLT